jgi:Flp pilus assembly protein TadD
VEPTPSPQQKTPRKTTILALAAAGTLVAVAVFAAWGRWNQRSSDGDDAETPPASPYLNTAAGVRYVGDKVCARCHTREYESYRQHPMGNSMAPAAEPVRPSPEDGAVESFDALGSHFRVERRGQRLYHQEIFCAQGREMSRQEEEVHFVVGSGRQGRSFLVNRGGFLFQSPISWYARQQGVTIPFGWDIPAPAWDLSPGYADNFRHFCRPITNNCLFCHADRIRPVGHAVSRYRQPLFPRQMAIGCERCHGPGELHVRERRREAFPKGPDRTIVNPKKLTPALREAVCQQCHILGEVRVLRRGRTTFDYRPGLPLHQFVSIFVRPAEKADHYKSVSHVEQMYVSRCYRESRGNKKLGCITCHDPHRLPEAEEKVSHYRKSCLKCHRVSSCSLAPRVRRKRRPDDSCIACHMPRADSSNIAHAAITDHRIMRDPDHPPKVTSGLPPDAIPLLHFHGDLVEAHDKDLPRDLALAMIAMARGRATAELRPRICYRALPDLEEAVAAAPRDVAAWEALGYARWQLRRLGEALEAYREALALAPEREVALQDASRVALALGKTDEAYRLAKRFVAVNPWDDEGHSDLAVIHMRREEWRRALREARRTVRLNPGSVPARLVMIGWHLQRREKKQARAVFRQILALEPPNADKIRRWFTQESKLAP